MASHKDSKITWAVKVMIEKAKTGTRRDVESWNDKAYEDWAKGSNNRKDELRAGYNRAQEILKERGL